MFTLQKKLISLLILFMLPVFLLAVPQVSVECPSQSEGQKLYYHILLSEAGSDVVTLSIDVSDGTATAPGDYDTTPEVSTVTFAVGEVEKTVWVQTNQDTFDEGVETVKMTATVTAGTTSNDVSVGFGSIIDDDGPVEYAIGGVSSAEVTEHPANPNLAVLVFTVTLTQPATPGLTIHYSTSGSSAEEGVDFYALDGDFTFNQGDTSATFYVTVIDDSLVEYPEKMNFSAHITSGGGWDDGWKGGSGTIYDDDGGQQTLPEFTSLCQTVTEGEDFHFNITLSEPAVEDTEFTIGYNDGTATYPADYGTPPVTVTIPQGATELPANQIITFPALTDDDGSEGDEVMHLTIHESGGYTDNAYVAPCGTILDAPPACVPEIGVTSDATPEGDDMTFFVQITNGCQPTDTITVHLDTVEGSATADDYGTLSQTEFTFTPSSYGTQNATLHANTDGDDTEGTEYMAVVGTITGGTTSNTTNPQGTGTIYDVPVPCEQAYTVSSPSATEGNDLVFTITLNCELAQGEEIYLQAETANGTATEPDDYTQKSQTLYFTYGSGLSQTFSVHTNSDGVQENTENMYANVSVTSGMPSQTATGTGTIYDDGSCTPEVTMYNSQANEGQALAFVLELSCPSSTEVTVDLNTANGSATEGSNYDFEGYHGTYTFAPNSTSNTFYLDAYTDNVANEGDETMTFEAVGPNNTSTGTGIIHDTTTVCNQGYTVNNVTGDEGTDLVFEVTLFCSPDDEVTLGVDTLDWEAVAPGDYNALSNIHLTFAAGATGSDLTQTVTVHANTDTVLENDERFNLVVSSVYNISYNDVYGIGTIIDTTTVCVPAMSVNNAYATEGDPLHFTATLSCAPTEAITLNYSTADGTATAGSGDYNPPIGGQVTFAAGQTSQPILIQTNADTDDTEPTEIMYLHVTPATAGTTSNNEVVGTGYIYNTASCFYLDTDKFGSVTTVVEGNTLHFVIKIREDKECQHDEPFKFGWETSHISTNDLDFNEVTGSTIVNPDDTEIIVDVPTIDDLQEESTEQMRLNYGTDAFGSTSGFFVGTIEDNDQCLNPILSIGDRKTEEGLKLEFSAKLSCTPNSDFTFEVMTSDITAVAPDDYVAIGSPTVYTIAAGTSSVDIPVETIDDAIVENNPDPETMELLYTQSESDPMSNAQSATGFIYDNDECEQKFTIEPAEAQEGDQLAFVAKITCSLGEEYTFDWGTEDDSAVYPDDYIKDSGTGIIPAGSLQTIIYIDTVEDSIHEETETMSIEYYSPNGSGSAIGTIYDDDPAGCTDPTLSIAEDTVTEGQTLHFVFTLSCSPAEDVKIEWGTEDGTAVEPGDYVKDSGTLSILAGQTTGTVDITTNNDNIDEDTEFMTMTGEITAGTTVPNTQTAAKGYILDNDPAPTVTISDATVGEGGDLVFNVSLSNPSSVDTVINVAAGSDEAELGVDFNQTTTTTVTILAGQTGPVEVKVSTINDDIDEVDETMELNGVVTSGNTANTSINAAGTIIDNDPKPTVSISDATAIEGDNLVFNVTLSNPSSQDTEITIYHTEGSATNPEDYTDPTPPILKILAGDITGAVTVHTTENTVNEPTETMTLNGTVTSGNTANNEASATGTINDDDGKPTVIISNAEATEGDVLVFNVTLSNSSSQDTEITIYDTEGSATNPEDYTDPTPSFVTIPAGQTGPETVTVKTKENNIHESTETMTLNGAVTSGDTSNANASATGTIIDDDPLPKITITDENVTEGVTFNFKVGLTTGSIGVTQITCSTVNFAGSATENEDYTPHTQTFIFQNGETGLFTFDVLTADDDKYELMHEQMYVNCVLDSGTTDGANSVGVGDIKDNDNKPTFSMIAAQTVTEGEDDFMTFTLQLSNPSFLDSPIEVMTADGNFTAPKMNAISGEDYIAYGLETVVIPAGTTSLEFNVTVVDNTVNEPSESMWLIGTPNSGFIENNGTVISVEGEILDNDDPANTPPVANNDSSTGNAQGDTVSIVVTDNDTDDDGTVDVATVDLNPAADGIQNTLTTADGAWSANASGGVTFVPNALFSGTSTAITYTVNDNESAVSNVATITIGYDPDGYFIDFKPTVSVLKGIAHSSGPHHFSFDIAATNLGLQEYSFDANNMLKIKIEKNDALSLSYDSTVIFYENHEMQNSLWEFDDSDPFLYVLTYTGIDMPNQRSRFSFSATLNVGVGDVGKFYLEATIINGSGGDTENSNNNDTEVLQKLKN